MIRIIRSSKSIANDGVASGKGAVASRSSLSPHPALSNVIMVEVSPKVILTRHSLSPAPGLLDPQVRTVHVGHVVTVSELGEFGGRTVGSLAEVISDGVAGDLKAANGVSHSDNTSSPSLVEGLIRVGVGGEVRVVVIEGTGEHLRMNDAGNWQLLSAGSVSILRVTAVAGHPSHVAVLLVRPNGCLESQALLIGNTLTVIREVLRDRIRRCGTGHSSGKQQASHKDQLTC